MNDANAYNVRIVGPLTSQPCRFTKTQGGHCTFPCSAACPTHLLPRNLTASTTHTLYSPSEHPFLTLVERAPTFSRSR